MDQNCDLYFPLPEQTEVSKEGKKELIEGSRDRLKHLPFGDQRQATKEIFNILFKSNRSRLAFDERAELLNDIEGPAFQVMNGLQEKIKDVAVPIGRNDEATAKMLVGTHYEIALAYRCLLKDRLGNGSLRTADKIAVASCIRLVIYHLGEILRTKYKVLTNPSGTIWKYIYTLFICAHENDIHNISLPASIWCRFNSVEGAFKSILLLSISSPLTMRGMELNALYDLTPELIQYIDLGKIRCGEKYSDLMTFNLSGTEPPKKQFATGCDSCSNAANCFAISTSPLIEYFEQQHGQITDGEQLTPVQKLLSTHQHLDSLKRNLSGSERAGYAKRIKGGDLRVDIVVGFSDVYTYLNKGMSDPADGAEGTGGLAESDSWTTIGEDVITVEDTDNWTTTGIIRAGLRKTVCNVINHSSGGYCLYKGANEKFHLRVGELAIVKESDKSAWRMAVIVWVSGTKERMDFGVKLLEGAVTTGTLRPIHPKDTDKNIDCLLLTNDNGQDRDSVRFVTASADYHKGDLLLINYLGREYRVSVRKINSKTNGYAEYTGDLSEAGKADTLDRKTVPKEDESSETDFESIWDVL